jgi:hypothetical protein
VTLSRRSGIVEQNVIPDGSIDRWDHVVGVPDPEGAVLFYNSESGACERGLTPKLTPPPPFTSRDVHFEKGWTQIITCWRSRLVLFYNKATGAGWLLDKGSLPGSSERVGRTWPPCAHRQAAGLLTFL